MKNPRIPRYTISLVREGSIEVEKYTQVGNSAAVSEIAHKVMDPSDRELFAVVTLDTKNKIIGFNVVSMGSLAQSIVHPRETLKLAILQNASSIIMVHNHPSGVVDPSVDDRDMTRRMVEAGKIMGIKVLDSIIIGAGNPQWFSFADSGMI